jgi:aspartate/methionine/tyrosine aminotransferase
MKINKLLMEDWLADNQLVKYNMSESGYADFILNDILNLCNEDINNLKEINLMNPDTRGSIELRNEIVACYENVKPENVLVTTGVTEALFSFFNSILEAGDEVIVEYPEFQTLSELPRAIGCDIKYLELKQESNYLPCLKTLESMISSKTKLIIINSPHNPTGSTLDEETIKDLSRLAKKHDVYILFDEHYKFLPLQPGTELLKSGFDICYNIHKKVAATGSITKCFGANGLRIGWLISDDEIIEECREYKHYLTHVTSPISDYLATVMLKNKDKIISHVKNHILKNVKTLNIFMEKYNNIFEYVEPKGGLVAFPKIKGSKNSDRFCNELLTKKNVSLLPGAVFRENQHFRISLGIESDKFKEAIDLIGSFLDEYKEA